MKNKLTSSDNEFVISRVFNAPVERVWKTWTVPGEIMKWWGPQGFTAPYAKVDLRKGGSYLYCMRGTMGDFAGKDFWSGGEFKEVDAPHRLVLTDYFTNEKGEKMDPVSYGMSADFPKESTVTILFEPAGKKTRLSIIYILPESEASREAIRKSGMEEGWNSSLDRFQKIVEG